LIDKHARDLKVHFRFAGLRIGNLSEKKRCVLRLHHDELDEPLGHLSALCGGLDFCHKNAVVGFFCSA